MPTRDITTLAAQAHCNVMSCESCTWSQHVKTDVQSYRACMFCGLISAPQGAAMQVRGISVLVPYHHAEGASSLSGDSNSMRHSPAEKTDACMRNWLSCQGGDSWVVNPISQELEKCTHTHTPARARTDRWRSCARLASGFWWPDVPL